MKFIAIKKWKTGGETVMEYFNTRYACVKWIEKQPQPKDDSWMWCVGQY